MKRLLLITPMLCLLAAPKAMASEPVTALGDDIVKETSEQAAPSQGEDWTFRFGGYGESVAAFKNYGINRFYGGTDGNTRINRNTISIPRFVLAADCKFSKRLSLGFEIEFESGGTGAAYEIENTENGEYETEVEKGGEVAIEQFHLTYSILDELNVRAGHLIVPVGLTNAHHEPINFFGTVRPEGETTLLPSTWHDTGLEIFGSFGKGYASFNYQAMVIAGLNANGFNRNKWVGDAKQGIFEEDNFTSPGYAFRLDYVGVPGLRAGLSYYFCADAGRNADKPDNYNKKIPVRIYSADLQYSNSWLTARGNIVYGNLGNSTYLSNRNSKLSSKSPYTRTAPIAKKAMAVGGEVGVNLKTLTGSEKMPVLYPFVRYEFYNPQHRGEATQVMDQRLKTSMWTMGMNWKVMPTVVVKADYTTRRIGGGKYNSENEFAVGVAFVGWFFQK